jgi:hypothetical protein
MRRRRRVKEEGVDVGKAATLLAAMTVLRPKDLSELMPKMMARDKRPRRLIVSPDLRRILLHRLLL